LALTNEGDVVLDPFGGVGTVLLASDLLKRKAVMAEIDPKYADLAKTRLADLRSGDLKIRKIGTPIFQPKGTEKVSQVPVEWGEE
jgi:DNA modification methylase